MPTNSLEHQWSEFIASDNSCLLEGSDSSSYIASGFIQEFKDFDTLYAFLKVNTNLLTLENLAMVFLKSYDGKTYIKLFEELKEIKNPKLDDRYQELKNIILFPAQESYKKAIKQCQAHVKEGDIYQANLCHKFIVKLQEKYSKETIKNTIYKKLRKLNPSEYMALAEFEDHIVFSSSPESLLKIELKDGDYNLSSSPIKGTAYLGEDLETLMNAKEKAEHIMIVDLIRNDLGRISQTASVKVEKLLEDKQYKNLQHLVSKIKSKLKKDLSFNIEGLSIPDFETIFDAIFPGGSITGAPKIKSIEIIEGLESNPRELFTGSLGFYKFNQQKGEFNILIRSIFYKKETAELSFSTGAGITSSSDPQKEYEETLLKAQKLIEVFE